MLCLVITKGQKKNKKSWIHKLWNITNASNMTQISTSYEHATMLCEMYKRLTLQRWPRFWLRMRKRRGKDWCDCESGFITVDLWDSVNWLKWRLHLDIWGKPQYLELKIYFFVVVFLFVCFLLHECIWYSTIHIQAWQIHYIVNRVWFLTYYWTVFVP